MIVAEITDAELECAIVRLVEQMPRDKLCLLADLIDQVRTTTGFGDVKIVIAAGRVELLKAENSYR